MVKGIFPLHTEGKSPTTGVKNAKRKRTELIEEGSNETAENINLTNRRQR